MLSGFIFFLAKKLVVLLVAQTLQASRFINLFHKANVSGLIFVLLIFQVLKLASREVSSYEATMDGKSDLLTQGKVLSCIAFSENLCCASKCR